ncbi:MAG TPA: hypothetical protein VKY19_03150 [Ktedonosporobacter sp.]|jgi:acyl carrier protein|nr:hypothetical protein [Ktedonosporobacter sp.]
MAVELSRLQNAVMDFLEERGYSDRENLDITEPLNLDSLSYLALILHLENALELQIDDSTFFTDSNPEMESIESICSRLLESREERI